jgi:hypothetical protein
MKKLYLKSMKFYFLIEQDQMLGRELVLQWLQIAAMEFMDKMQLEL